MSAQRAPEPIPAMRAPPRDGIEQSARADISEANALRRRGHGWRVLVVASSCTSVALTILTASAPSGRLSTSEFVSLAGPLGPAGWAAYNERRDHRREAVLRDRARRLLRACQIASLASRDRDQAEAVLEAYDGLTAADRVDL